jgi:hypothetical protein
MAGRAEISERIERLRIVMQLTDDSLALRLLRLAIEALEEMISLKNGDDEDLQSH